MTAINCIAYAICAIDHKGKHITMYNISASFEEPVRDFLERGWALASVIPDSWTKYVYHWEACLWDYED